MSHNILVTGASGYLGGTLLANLSTANLPAYSTLYALVRTPAQSAAVQKYDATPLEIDLSSPDSIRSAIISKQISIVYHLINATDTTSTEHFISALAQVKRDTGKDVHFLFTTGAKLFSEHAGAPTDRPLLDTDPALYDIQRSYGEKAPHSFGARGVRANCIVTEKAEELGVKSYVFAPCIVYGRGEGFGNIISIQTVAILKAAKALRGVYKVDKGRPTWPVCHVKDNTSLYIEILRGILEGKDVGHGRLGYFLASPGSVAWDDIYEAMAKALKKRGIVDDDVLREADGEVLEKMGTALGCPKDFVPVQLGGLCTFTAEHGKNIGWKTQFQSQHILDAADEEVDLILQNLKD